MAFFVGQKVVCVDAHPSNGCHWADTHVLDERVIYTVSAVAIDDEGDPVLMLREISRDNWAIPFDPWYAWYGAFRFRPVVERKSDISALTALLNPANHKKLEDVS